MIFIIILSLAVLVGPQLEKLLSILPSNLHSVRIRHLRIIKPVTGILKGLEGVINREQNAISSNLSHTEIERSGREMTTGRNPQILRKVFPNGLLARLLQPEHLLAIFKPVINPPHIEGDSLSQMAQNHLQLGVPIKCAVRHHSKSMQTDSVCK